jgi:hypothetical protein
MSPDLDHPEQLREIQADVAAERAVVETVRGAVAEVGFRTVARAKARLASYEKVSGNYNSYIEKQAEELKNGLLAASPYKELGVARLIALWLTESEQFFNEAEPLLGGAERSMRQGYLEQSFERLPTEVKDRLMNEFREKKDEILVWFVGKVQDELVRNSTGVIDVLASEGNS